MSSFGRQQQHPKCVLILDFDPPETFVVNVQLRVRRERPTAAWAMLQLAAALTKAVVFSRNLILIWIYIIYLILKWIELTFLVD